jgi:hypothetical protein
MRPILQKFPADNYEYNLKTFKVNILETILNSTFIEKINNFNLEEMFELLKNKNIFVTNLPVFKFKGETHLYDITEDNINEKYEILTLD